MGVHKTHSTHIQLFFLAKVQLRSDKMCFLLYLGYVGPFFGFCSHCQEENEKSELRWKNFQATKIQAWERSRVVSSRVLWFLAHFPSTLNLTQLQGNSLEGKAHLENHPSFLAFGCNWFYRFWALYENQRNLNPCQSASFPAVRCLAKWPNCFRAK